MSRPKREIDWLEPSTWAPCPYCKGRGLIRAIPPKCPSCKGLGKRPTSYRLKREA